MSTFNYILRTINPADLPILHYLFWQNDPRRLIHTPSALAIVAEHNTHIIGFGQISRWVHCAEISDLFVLETCRNHGVGTALITHLLHHALSMDISCVEIGANHDNNRAIALYRRLGFQDHYATEHTTYLKLLINQQAQP